MNFKECKTCGKVLTKRIKVLNRCSCKTCFKEQKAKYEAKRDRTKTPILFTHKCKFCSMQFQTYTHDKEYCSDECKRRYTNAVRRVRRRV